MSRPQAQVGRPGAKRPGAPATQTGPAETARKGPSIEELRNLPAVVEDGQIADLDPSNVSEGRVLNEPCKIATAKFVIQDWKRKDGSYPENSWPEVQIELGLQRAGSTSEDRPYRHRARYATPATFGISKDGDRVMVRPGVAKEGYVPKFRKDDEGQRLIASFVDAGLVTTQQLKEKGAAALVGITAHFRSREVEVNRKTGSVKVSMLLVDAPGGTVKTAQAETTKTKTAPAPAAPAAQVAAPAVVAAAPAETAGVTSELAAFAQEALLDVIKAAGGEIEKSKIAAGLINISKWKAHAQRGPILQAIRTGTTVADAASAGLIIIDGDKLIQA